MVRIATAAIVGQYGGVEVRGLEAADANRAADLFNEAEPEFVRTTDHLRHELGSASDPTRRRYWIAAEDGDVVGVATAYRRWWNNERDVARIHLGVRSDRRRRGIGTALLRAAEQHCAAHGATRLQVRARQDSAGARFAASRGYVRRVSSEQLWSLDPRAAELDDLHELERRLADAGCRLRALRDLEDSTRELFDFYGAAGGIPPGSPVTFEQWRAAILENPVLERDGSFCVVHGGRPVALAWLLVDHERSKAEHEWTATHPDFRGRGLARFAKLATIRWCAENRIREIVTENDVDNVPMIELNRSLGYRELEIRDDLERSGNALRASAGST